MHLLCVAGHCDALGLGAWLRWLLHRHSIFDLTGHQRKRLFNVLGVLGGSLKESHAIVISEFLALFVTDLTLGLQIAFVTDEDARDVVSCVLLDLLHPSLDCGERLAVGDVVSHDDAVGSLVVAGSDGLKAFLSGRVPNLELDNFTINLVVANFEVYTDGGHEAL